jgi:hypothetical protein
LLTQKSETLSHQNGMPKDEIVPGLGAGDWGLGTQGWGLGAGDSGLATRVGMGLRLPSRSFEPPAFSLHLLDSMLAQIKRNCSASAR